MATSSFGGTKLTSEPGQPLHRRESSRAPQSESIAYQVHAHSYCPPQETTLAFLLPTDRAILARHGLTILRPLRPSWPAVYSTAAA